jgi:hypothetical protein
VSHHARLCWRFRQRLECLQPSPLGFGRIKITPAIGQRNVLVCFGRGPRLMVTKPSIASCLSTKPVVPLNRPHSRLKSVTDLQDQNATNMILTQAVLASIPALVEQGLNTEAIAARLGCKVATLKVRCSQAQISLRVPKEAKMVPLVPEPTPPLYTDLHKFRALRAFANIFSRRGRAVPAPSDLLHRTRRGRPSFGGFAIVGRSPRQRPNGRLREPSRQGERLRSANIGFVGLWASSFASGASNPI